MPGLCFVLVLWVSSGTTYVLDTLLWQKGDPSKNALFQESLHRIREAVFQPNGVYFDVWYAAYPTLDLLDSWGWRYTARLKSSQYLNGTSLKDTGFFGAKSQSGQ